MAVILPNPVLFSIYTALSRQTYILPYNDMNMNYGKKKKCQVVGFDPDTCGNIFLPLSFCSTCMYINIRANLKMPNDFLHEQLFTTQYSFGSHQSSMS